MRINDCGLDKASVSDGKSVTILALPWLCLNPMFFNTVQLYSGRGYTQRPMLYLNPETRENVNVITITVYLYVEEIPNPD